MKINPELVKSALKALTDCNIVENGAYPNEYAGYISSFGAAIIQSGLLPAVIFFESESDAAQNRHKVISAIKQVTNTCLPVEEQIGGRLARYIIENNKSTDSDLLNKITDSAVALKLALRMYKKKQ